MVTRLLGRKLGMTQVYADVLRLRNGTRMVGSITVKPDQYTIETPAGTIQFKKDEVDSAVQGACFPCTVIEAGPCTVTQVKTQERDGYAAVQIAFGQRRKKTVSRAELGHLVPRGDTKPQDRRKQLDRAIKELKESPRILREVPWDGKEEVKVGDQLTVSIFASHRRVDVIGTSKGRGFMGVVRRWGFHGLPATHGQSDRERAPGSLGRQHSISQGVYPGKRMAGHWGVEQVTSRNLDVVKINPQKNILIVHGAVPGPNGGFVLVKESHWVPPKPSVVVSKKMKPAGKK